MSTLSHTCQECGTRYTPRAGRGQSNVKFCTRACSLKFKNRAMERGSQIYHLFRGLRRDRAKAKALGVWTEMCRLETMWEDEDRANNRKVPSWRPLKDELYHLLEVRDLRPTTNVGFVREPAN